MACAAVAEASREARVVTRWLALWYTLGFVFTNAALALAGAAARNYVVDLTWPQKEEPPGRPTPPGPRGQPSSQDSDRLATCQPPQPVISCSCLLFS